MAAVPATARSFGPDITVPTAVGASAPVRRPVLCRWIVDPASGKLVCVWDDDPLPRQFALHLRLVKA